LANRLKDIIVSLNLHKSEFWKAEKIEHLYAHEVNGAVTLEMAQDEVSGIPDSTVHHLTFIGADSAAGAAAPYVTSQIWPTEILTTKGDKIRFKPRLADDPVLDWAMHFNEDSWKMSARARNTGKTLEEWFGCTSRLESLETRDKLREPPVKRQESLRIYRLLVIHQFPEAASFDVVRYLNNFDIKVAYYPVWCKDLPPPATAIHSRWRLFIRKENKDKRLSSETPPALLRYDFMKKLQGALGEPVAEKNAQAGILDFKRKGNRKSEQLTPPFLGESWEFAQAIAGISQLGRRYDPVRDTLGNNSYIVPDQERQGEGEPTKTTEAPNGSVEDEIYSYRRAMFQALSTVLQEAVEKQVTEQSTTKLQRELCQDFLTGFERYRDGALKTRHCIEYDPNLHSILSTNPQVDELGETPMPYTGPPPTAFVHHKRIRISKDAQKAALFAGYLIFNDSHREMIHDGTYSLPWTSRAKTSFDILNAELAEMGWLPPNYQDAPRQVIEMDHSAKPVAGEKGHIVILVPTTKVQCIVTLYSPDLEVEVEWPDGNADEALMLEEGVGITTTKRIQFLAVWLHINR
jgi:hypothetical protein